MRDLENSPSTQLPLSLKVGDNIVSDKERMTDIFNQHFIKSSYIYAAANSLCVNSPPNPPVASHPTPSRPFTLQAVTGGEVLDELLRLDSRKPAGSDDLDPYFF